MEQHLGSETCSQGTKSIPSEGGPQPESWTAGSSEPKIQGKFRAANSEWWENWNRKPGGQTEVCSIGMARADMARSV